MNRLELEPNARALYVEFANAIERELIPAGELATVKAFASKLPENAARIAGVLTLIANPDAWTIKAEVLGDAIRLAQYYLEEAKRLTATGAIDPELRNAETLRQWLLERPGNLIGCRTIYQFGPNAIRSAAKARSAMALLVAHGWAKHPHIPAPCRGRF